MTARKPVAPFYAAAAVWLVYALAFPLYRPAHYILVAAVAAAVPPAESRLCRATGAPPPASAAPRP